MRTRNWWVGVAAGLVVGLGAVVGVEAATDEASAQAGFSVSAAQLQINQKISQAAVRRGNRSLNYLAPIRTAATDDADEGEQGVRPLAEVPGSGEGWTTSQIADGAITESKVSGGVRQGLAGFASVDINGDFTANSGAFSAVERLTEGTYALTTAEPVSLERCAANVTVIDAHEARAYSEKFDITGDRELRVRIHLEGPAGGTSSLNDEPFSITLFCTA